MGLYPLLESADGHHLQHIAEVKFRLEKDRNFSASLYKKYKRGFNIVDGIDTALALYSVGLAASGIGLLSTIIAATVATGIQVEAVVCGLLGAGGKLIGRRLQAKAKNIIRSVSWLTQSLTQSWTMSRPPWLTTRFLMKGFA